MKKRKISLAVAIAALAMIAFLPAAGVSAPLSTSTKMAKTSTWSYAYNQHGNQVRVKAFPHASSNYPFWFWVDNGTKVKMICWQDTVWYKGNYKSNRWFYATFYTPLLEHIIGRGYVHSSYVYYQTTVPHC